MYRLLGVSNVDKKNPDELFLERAKAC